VPILQQARRSLEMSVCVSSTAVCTVPGGVCPAAACASLGHICSIAACAVPEGIWPTAACAAPGHVCLQELLCCAWGVCLVFTRAGIAPGVSVYKTFTVLHYCVSVFKSFCYAPGRFCLQEPVLCLEELCAAPEHDCLQESVLTWMCMSTRACAAPVRLSTRALCCLQVPSPRSTCTST
jgi:hypothetical protein